MNHLRRYIRLTSGAVSPDSQFSILDSVFTGERAPPRVQEKLANGSAGVYNKFRGPGVLFMHQIL